MRKGFASDFEMSDKMSDKEKMFYRLLFRAFETADFVTTKTMSGITGMAESTTRRYLTKFCNMGLIQSDGKNRGTKYLLKSDG